MKYSLGGRDLGGISVVDHQGTEPNISGSLGVQRASNDGIRGPRIDRYTSLLLPIPLRK